MAAYVIVDIDVKDKEGYEEYKKLAAQSVVAYHGKYLARGGTTERIEGNWQPKRLVVLEFESLAEAKAWWHSETYEVAKQLRHKTAITNMVMIEGT